MIFVINENRPVAKEVFRMVLRAAIANEEVRLRPGQFVNIAVEGCYLRRPISVCDWDARTQTLTLLYKTVGTGTRALARCVPGTSLDLLTGLGNGYTPVEARRPALLGGGVGTPPLYFLAKELAGAGQKPVAVLGFNTKDEMFYHEEFATLCDVIVTTADGSYGQKGFVTDALPGLAYDALYVCGPEPMLQAVFAQARALPAGHAQFSFERRMGCGFGACMVCSCKTTAGYKRICKDGPILTKEEILWT
ncbi:MAG: dihydroorotate dehydrogenase electron transfer subunit [Oscillospiraceae bacterium]|jgi:dihydroorotate dehydrogenase electron transfer subunit|nr:dihydroorotate dehydrogenase electron transfer subunit [Oscillospiraceae bacterium]